MSSAFLKDVSSSFASIGSLSLSSLSMTLPAKIADPFGGTFKRLFAAANGFDPLVLKLLVAAAANGLTTVLEPNGLVLFT